MLDAARRGESWAFDELFRQWSRPLSAFVAGRGVVDVDDVVSEILLAVFRSIDQFSGSEAGFRAWVFRIARNKIADSFRRAGRQPVTIPLADELEVTGGDVEDDALAQLGRDRVEALLGDLTDDQCEVLLLRIVADLTVAQIADLMGRRVGAVKQLQRRALRRLERRLLEQEQVLPSRPVPLVEPPAIAKER